MRKYATIIFLLIGLLSCIIVQAQKRKFQVDKEPGWITINPLDYRNQHLDHEAEGGYIDVAFEKQVNLQQQVKFYKKTIRIISEAGVQNRSEVTVVFDPSYEHLVFHTIRIMRGNEWINKLEPSKIKVIQQETELERHIYDQSLSAILVLEDVRKNDIIEYSYSIRGFNTIFDGKYSDIFETAFGVPVNNLYYKVIVPSGRELTIKNIGASIQPGIQNAGDLTTYEWRYKNVSALRVQDKLPSWYDPYPSIFLSEFQSWTTVADWALKLFPDVTVLSPELQKKISEIRDKEPTPEKRILEALRFVQDDIRYMGFEMGEKSHKPFPPAKVLAQRFGDCKDKVYLFCTMLDALNIEADPVLINTDYKKTIKTWLPSATAFDHVIVQVNLDGNTYYFDPTISYQRGDELEDISFPNYHCGLVIRKGTGGLIDISMREKGLVKVKEIFDIPDMNGQAKLKVVTSYSGSFADEMRSYFRNNSRYEMLKRFRDYYASYFEKIKGDSLEVRDNEKSGVIISEEYYSISDFWKITDLKKKVQFEPFVINSVFKKPTDQDRVMPFFIGFPSWYKEEIEINVPEYWNAKSFNDDIDCANFFVKCQYTYSNKRFLLKYEYKSLKDHVSVSEAPRFIESYDKISKSLSYSLSWTEGNSANQTIQMQDIPKRRIYIGLTIAFIVIVFIGRIIWRIIRK